MFTSPGKHSHVLHKTKQAPQDFDFHVNRTFLCFVRRLRNPDSVNQSTTEAHGGVNPRRVLATLSMSD